MYGPFTYVLLGVPYAVAQAAGLDPQLAVRLGVVGAMCFCLLLVFFTSWQMHRSRPVAWLCILFAVSTTPLAQWTTLVRGDFLAVGCSLTSIYLLMSPNRSLRVLGSSVFARIAVLIKSTFFSAPVAIVLWYLYKRQYREGAFRVAVFACLIIGGYTIALWREPLMLDHLMALRHPVLEYRGAFGTTLGRTLAACSPLCGTWLLLDRQESSDGRLSIRLLLDDVVGSSDHHHSPCGGKHKLFLGTASLLRGSRWSRLV
jgi:hypothetical protein